MTTLSSFKRMKTMNRATVLNAIRLLSPISRADIAKETGLTAPTVGKLVKELVDEGYVCETTAGPSSGGRKPTLLQLNRDVFSVIGLDIGSTAVKGVLSNLLGEVIDATERALPLPCSKESLLATATQVTDELLQAQDSKRILTGIGIAMHGLVDIVEGRSLFAPNLNLRDIPIRDHFEQIYQTNVHVENDARAMALGEAWFGHGKDVPSHVFINIGRGVGAGIVMGRTLHHGANNVGGEIGHLVISEDGPRCACGQQGCLQAYISGPSLVSSTKEQLATGDTNVPRLECGEDVCHLALRGNEVALSVFQEAGRVFGLALVNVIHTFDPSAIIIGGGVSNAAAFFLPQAQEVVIRRGLTEEVRHTPIIVSALKDKAAAIGAVTLLLEDIFQEKF
ncbi:ROK family transcriptional regulator [Litoribacterium kuwaitense]|uniref:ROK family transcriptional regulator n=1 Tax=Litoribacterium kuwaitense TaxID=1398745 RepID=UPI001FE6C6CB|nr:ROK family transcriptional regulator [Litoribacterium kuwaitense]